MSEQKLEIVIGGNTVDARKSIQQLEDQLKRFRDGLKDATGGSILRYNAAIEATQKRILSLKGTFEKVNTATAKTGASMTNLSRIVQDAPFGFIAIQNNLDPLIQSFGQLKRESGSTGAALAKMFGALAGPAGIALGFAAVSSALTVAIQKYGSFGAVIQKVMGTATEEQLMFNKAMLSGAAAAGEQINRLNLLTNITNNLSLGTKNVADASKLLSESVDKVIVSIDFQKEGIKGVNGELLDYAKKIVIARNQLAAFSAVAGDLSKELVEAQLEGVTFTDKFVAGLNKVSLALELLKAGEFSKLAELTKTSFEVGALERYNKRLAEITARQKKLNDLQNKFVVDQTKEGIRVIDLFGGSEDKKTKTTAAKSAKTIKEEVKRVFGLERLDFVSFFDLNEAGIKAKAEEFGLLFKDGFATALKTAGTVSGKVEVIPSSTVQDAVARLKTMQVETDNLTTRFNDFLAPAIDTVFGALANGSNIFDAIKQSLKAMVVQLGITVAKAAVLAAIMSVIMPGGAAVGAGGAAVKGFGGIFKSLLGGLVGSSQIGNPNFSGAGNALGSVQFRLAGSDLVGSIQRTQGRINRVG